MSHLVASRREFARLLVALTPAAVPQSQPHQPGHVVALGCLSRHGGQVTVSGRLANAASTPDGR